MDIKVTRNNDFLILMLNGEINADNVAQLRDVFMPIVSEKINKVILDFETVSFMDSSGLASLIELVQKLRKVNGKLSLCNVNKDIRGVLEITKVHKIVAIHDSMDQALKG
ncbi:MAG: STAS domain-containing protein [Candidatus Omnitrophica bacterium]|nr:STAS domain-containing protein [Candidatus Omnitrophota bacterium]